MFGRCAFPFNGPPSHKHLYVSKRINAPIGDPNRRCKLSVIAEAVSEFSEALPHSKLQPYDAHFHPYRGKGKPAEGRPAKSSSRRVGNPFVAINFIPKEFPVNNLSIRFCVSALIVISRRPFRKANWMDGITACATCLCVRRRH